MFHNKFQYKLFKAANECRSGAIKWSKYGDSIIFNFPQFKKEFLDPNDNFSKSCHLSSFVRQLNLYGFKKMLDLTRNSINGSHIKEYTNANFIRGRPDLLHYVTRNHASPTLFLTQPIKQEVISDDEVEKENDVSNISYCKKRKCRRMSKRNSRKRRKYRKYVKEAGIDYEAVQKSNDLVNVHEIKKEEYCPQHDISNVEAGFEHEVLRKSSDLGESGIETEEKYSELDIFHVEKHDLLVQQITSPENLKDQCEKEINDNNKVIEKNFIEFDKIDEKIPSSVPKKEENNPWNLDDYKILYEPSPECSPDHRKPNKHWEDMCKVAEELGINVQEVLRVAEEERKNRSICAKFQFVTPSLELISMEFETDKETVFLKRGSDNVLLGDAVYTYAYI